jgi:hypothetical protein
MSNNPKRVFLHCSATPDYPEESSRFDLFGAADIDAWHRKRGWSEIGYHYVVRRPGTIEEGDRHWSEYGAHVKGENKDTLGVCYIGTRWPTQKQINSLIAVFTMIWRKFGIHSDNWFGHYEFDKRKTCPGISMHLIREVLGLELERILSVGDERHAEVVKIRR